MSLLLNKQIDISAIVGLGCMALCW